ncbi:MAG: DUF3320 domain-containing protein, partial [Planctomycetota bacterium]
MNEESLVAAFERRRLALLDLTRRNRLLNFRPTRRTTVQIVDEVPSEIYRQLVIEGRTLGFLPNPELARGGRRLARRADGSGAGSAGATPQPAKGVPSAGDREGAGGAAAKRGEFPHGSASAASGRVARGAEELGVSVRGAPTRCPFCHDAVSPEEPNAACNACLSRHHAECWDELGRCASCGAGLALISDRFARPREEPGEGPEDAPSATGTFRRRAREKLPGRHRDRELQTELPPSELEKNLVAIARRAASDFEEQGFNTLFLALGFLEWREGGSRRLQRAPLLLVPVELHRRSVRSAYRLAASGDDLWLNPALGYKLEREFGIALPTLPEDEQELDPDAFFEAVAKELRDRPGWRVVEDAALGLFSFQRFVIYQDLGRHRAWILEHPLVRVLLGGAAPRPPGTEESPPRPPREVFSVLDADASQREAIAAALRGESFVLEGPPGTGKSQTIANIVAEFLGRGRSVLFVSEKMAALQVVRGRLAEVGLDAFCLELHSRHASKREVVRSLARTLEAEAFPDHDEDARLDELQRLGAELDAFFAALHEPLRPLGASPFQILSALEEEDTAFPGLVEAGLVGAVGAAASAWSQVDLQARERALVALGQALERTGDPAQHPLRGLCRAQWSYADRGRLNRSLAAAREAAARLKEALETLGNVLRCDPPTSVAAAAPLLDLAELLAEPQRPEGIALANPAWASEPPEVAEWIEDRTRLEEFLGQLTGRLAPEVLEREDLPALQAVFAASADRWWRVFRPAWWRARARIRPYLPKGKPGSDAELARDLSVAALARQARGRLRAAEGKARPLFGRAWDEEAEALRAARAAATQLAAHARADRVSPRLREALAAERLPPEESRSAAESVRTAVARWEEAWATLKELAEADEGALFGVGADAAAPAALAERLGEVEGALGRLDEWAELQGAFQTCRELGLQGFVRAAHAALVPEAQLAPTLRRAFFLDRLDAALGERPVLSSFDAEGHLQRLAAFRRLDERQLLLARVRLRYRLARARPDARWEASAGSELGLLQRELRRKRGHMPVRQLLARLPRVLSALKPCLFMSPLSVAQFTDPNLHTFDLVVFDEASQITPEDALGALARGRQAVVVGDSQQMPPTAFFRAVVASEAAEEEVAATDLESVLDACIASGMPRRVLRWHYRSRHESLIAFSNHSFYEGRLLTFPSPDDGRGVLGLRAVFVADGRYERGGSGRNEPEAEAVAAALIEHAERFPHRSVGVGTFSQAQQDAVLDALERRLRARPDLEAWFAGEAPERFFVKNLETLQGDERDVIFVSVGYGPDATGKLSLNFGPLNQAGGERRLNVLVTRAREQLVVFSSFRPEDLDTSRTQSRGVRLLRRYLEHAFRGTTPPPPEEPAAPALERRRLADAVAEALTERLGPAGFAVERDLGTSAVRVDLGLRRGDGFALGVLLDGPRWLAFPEARDRERIVPGVFARLGWRLERVWALEWHRHRERVLERLAAAAERAAAEFEEAAVAARAEERAKEGRNEEQEAAVRLRPVEETGEGKIAPYVEAAVAQLGGRDDFPRVAESELTALVASVVGIEGPLHCSELERRVLAHWGLGRGARGA